jgi:hypothetical protein
MYTHNPPEQFSLVTRAESTCVERCEPTKFERPLPLRLKHIQVRECLGAPTRLDPPPQPDVEVWQDPHSLFCSEQ